MFNTCVPFLNICSDKLLWSLKLRPHATGDFSMAVVQANAHLEDQCQVFTSDAFTVVGIFDGHGGYTAAEFVNDNLIPRLASLTAEGEMSQDAILIAFSETEADFLQLVREKANADPSSRAWQEVGSCCIVGVISGARLYVANLGDSRAVMGTRFQDMPIQAQRLTSDHNVNDSDHSLKFADQHPDVSNLITLVNRCHYVKGMLQVTKSIGDFHLKRNSMKRDYIVLEEAVISAVPDVTERDLTPQDQFVIFASDGFWEVMSDEAAVKIVHKNKRSGIAKRLVKAAQYVAARNWNIPYIRLVNIRRGMRRRVHDDISVVVIFFDHETRPGIATGSARPPVDIHTYNVQLRA